MEELVVERFNLVVKNLISQGRAKTQKEIAISVGIKGPLLTEILKGRSGLSAKLLHRFVVKWQINPSYLYGASEIMNLIHANMANPPDEIASLYAHVSQLIYDLMNPDKTDQYHMIKDELLDIVVRLNSEKVHITQDLFEIKELIKELR